MRGLEATPVLVSSLNKRQITSGPTESSWVLSYFFPFLSLECSLYKQVQTGH